MKKLLGALFTFLFLLPVCAFATNITFTSSGSIVDGNVFDTVYVRNNGTVVNMSGGQINDWLFTYDASTFNVSGGLITGNINLSYSNIINISAGTINTLEFVVYGSSVSNIYGGDITAERLKTSPDSIVNINGGIFDLEMFEIEGEVNIYRGLLNFNDASISHFSYLATINIYGYDFNYSQGTLTGYLLDNNFFTIKGVDALEYARFNLIPEPTSLLFFGIGLLSFRKNKKRRD
jgi:hypothetical protein